MKLCQRSYKLIAKNRNFNLHIITRLNIFPQIRGGPPFF